MLLLNLVPLLPFAERKRASKENDALSERRLNNYSQHHITIKNPRRYISGTKCIAGGIKNILLLYCGSKISVVKAPSSLFRLIYP